ncbi:ABC transporter ATP-binding protein [Paenibacillus sp. FSL H7-0331]|uniref:ABC transporter ATP-binding protein n=1 Tax=Paenibacillus sp. FSL H7-0331 TaxID=1920421 RepID=UPI00096FA3B4|nr:ABC transporter ATP-binding protein [Paenibacillus sp. FSL H7-0331]OMF12693.1 bacitracin ABC transporter ATP-binding protein [Paenibacillus sp. FSL H7-0331]
METILKTSGLTKKYKDHTAVDCINISLKKGEIYGFLGQNGAGKTTTIRMIMGLIQPTSGQIELFGQTLESGHRAAFERIGSMIEIPGFYPNLTAAENLDIHRRMMGMGNKESIEQSLEQAGLLDVRNKRVKSFSLGMKQRLGIARSLLHHPELLILDEPTNGLDPVGIKEVRNLIIELASKRNIAVLVSSHILSEVQQMATVLGIIHNGKLVEEIEQEALQMRNRHCVEYKVSNDRQTVMLLEQKLGIHDYSVPEPGIVRVFEQLSESAMINRTLVDNGIDVCEITMLRETLEDYFLGLTGGARSA